MRITIIIAFFLLFACSSKKKLERQAKQGDIQACYQIVDYCVNGHQNLEDEKIQQKIMKYSKMALTLVDTVQSDANDFYRKFFYFQLANSPLIKKEDRNDYNYKSALLGETKAQYKLAVDYYDGHERKPYKDSAFYWYKQTLDGDINQYSGYACEVVGDMLYNGKYIKQDTLMAIYYYKKACTCYGIYSRPSACDSVIVFYTRQKNLKDTTEIPIYSEFARKRRGYNSAR